MAGGIPIGAIKPYRGGARYGTVIVPPLLPILPQFISTPEAPAPINCNFILLLEILLEFSKRIASFGTTEV